jgi:hypothetical protein
MFVPEPKRLSAAAVSFKADLQLPMYKKCETRVPSVTITGVNIPLTVAMDRLKRVSTPCQSRIKVRHFDLRESGPKYRYYCKYGKNSCATLCHSLLTAIRGLKP